MGTIVNKGEWLCGVVLSDHNTAPGCSKFVQLWMVAMSYLHLCIAMPGLAEHTCKQNIIISNVGEIKLTKWYKIIWEN